MREYRRRLREAMEDPFLSLALDSFAEAFRQSRAQAFSRLDFEGLADRVADLRADAISRLPELVERFRERAQRAGARVHLAASAAQANRIIAEIATAGGVELVVKSKSMTAEETHLNPHLEELGLRVVETDLGEWIIQLREEGPSHMVMPAIHLSRQQVARLFSGLTGRPLDPDDIEGLVRVARRTLRQAFLNAQMGITGANVAVAESGTLGIVTNEGNARLVTTLPRIHVALVGMEKLVPDLAAALPILRLLPRNATAQAITSYVTWITGAVPCAAASGGAKELHVVLLDNGRLTLARDPRLGQALRCIRCGACANVCPVFRLVGGHNLGHVYIGAIGLVLTYVYHGRRQARLIARNCLGCQACASVCPSRIDLPALVQEVRSRVIEREPRRPLKNRVAAAVLSDRHRLPSLVRGAAWLQRAWAKGGSLIEDLPTLVGQQHGFRSLPVLASRPLRERWPGLVPALPARARSKGRLRVALFSGCLVDFAYPEQAEAMLRVLNRASGVAVELPPGQTCCGLPAAAMGEQELARQLARRNVIALAATGVTAVAAGADAVVTLCASCGSYIKERYPALLADDQHLAGEARALARKLVDFSSLVVGLVGVDALPQPRRDAPRTRAAYHAPCHLCRGLGVTEQPRRLLEVAGLDYVRCADEEVCCGFGGTYSLDFPEVSARLLWRKLDQVEQSGAELLVTDCPGCVLQLRGGLHVRGSRVRALHMAELLDLRLARR